jgi:hypothetical protein
MPYIYSIHYVTGIAMHNNFGKLRIVFFLIPISGFLLSCSGKSDQKPVSVVDSNQVPSSLHVPLIPQIGNTWCWAAVTEMITTYYHNAIDTNAPVIRQCDLCKLSAADSCNFNCDTLKAGNVPYSCDQFFGAPFPSTPIDSISCLGYIKSMTTGPDMREKGKEILLSQEHLVEQIRHRIPVIFTWFWSGLTTDATEQDSHFLVAEGIPHSSYITSHIWVSVHDPWPVGRGGHRIISYPEYANMKPTSIMSSLSYVFTSHGQDFYDFKYTRKHTKKESQ